MTLKRSYADTAHDSVKSIPEVLREISAFPLKFPEICPNDIIEAVFPHDATETLCRVAKQIHEREAMPV